MKTSIERAWDSAVERSKASLPKEDELIVFRVDELSSKGCYGGVDGAGHLLMAIEVKAPPPLIEIQSDAIDFFRHERRVQRVWLMVFRLKAIALAHVFGRLCQDLINEIEAVGNEPELLGVVQRRILQWQRLFENGHDGLLADFQIKGLIAELLYMESQLICSARTPMEMAAGWLGPSGGDQDFLFTNQAVEVKAVGPHADGVSISSLQQLDSVLPLVLHVRTMRDASPEEPNAESLNSVVLRVERIYAPHPQALSIFRGALLEAGFVAHPRYSEVAFETIAVEEFQVTGDFPRLTPSSVPAGISTASYVLSLQHLRAAR